MKKINFKLILAFLFILMVGIPASVIANENVVSGNTELVVGGNNLAQTIQSLTDGQKYYRAIHIMAMLLLGFGFLMVFVRKYGRSAITATFLLVSVSIPSYIMLSMVTGSW